MTAGLVHAPPQPMKALLGHKPQKGNHYVFITGDAYSGTTALYGLVSTSPAVSNLCRAKTTCCEGGPLLLANGLVPQKQPGNPEYPEHWNAALELYRKYWDTSKPILVEKTIGNAGRFPKIWATLKAAGAKASFIYLVRSKCAQHYQRFWQTSTRSEVQAAHALRKVGAPLHIVRYEEMMADPYGVARRLLAFLPELGTLDPTKSGVSDAPYVGSGSVRGMPILEFLKNRKYQVGFPPLRAGGTMAYTDGEQADMAELGYTEEWFTRFWPRT